MTSTESTLKAYVVRGDDEFSMLVFAPSPGQAKAMCMGNWGDDYIWLRATREPKLDRYGSPNNIPAYVLVGMGWWFECHNCGMTINEDGLYDSHKDPLKAVGTYNSAIYCDEGCETFFAQERYKEKGTKATLKAHYEGRISARFGPDIDFVHHHFYIRNGDMVNQVVLEVRMPFQKVRTCSFRSGWEKPLSLDKALKTKLNMSIPNADMEAAREFFYEREGISID